MAYFWEDKIADVTYTNAELDTVKILWKDDMNIYREHYLKVDEEDQQFQALMKVTSYEDIEGRTREANAIARQDFKDAFDRYGKNMGFDIFKSGIDFFRFFSGYNNEDASDREKLFSFKLTVFEYDEVKNSDTSERSKKAKTAIRKAERPEHILAALQIFRNDDAELKLDDDGNVIGVYFPFV